MPAQYELKNLYDSKDYEMIVFYWQNLEERERFNEWDFLYCMNALYSLKRYNDCLECYRVCNQRYPRFDKLNDKMGWALYHDQLKNFDFKTEEASIFEKKTRYVLKHCTDSQFSPKWKVIELYIDKLNSGDLGKPASPEEIAQYLDFVNPENLSTEEWKMTDESGKSYKMASNCEKWFGKKTKAELQLGHFEECIQLVDQATRLIRKYHNNNNYWFAYRKAISLSKLGYSEKARAIINSILNSGFSHWILYQALFEIEKEDNQIEEAIKQGAYCALADREHKMRVSFYPEYADFLLKNGYSIEAAMHYRLVELIREEEGWKKIHVSNEISYSEEILSFNKREILKKLNGFWIMQKDRGVEFLEGRINKILAEGKSGFIRDTSGNDYYFNIKDFVSKDSIIQEGERVRFTLVDRLDKKKNEMKKNAANISFMK